MDLQCSFCLLTFCLFSKKEKSLTHLREWKEAAVNLVRLSGIAFLILWVFNIGLIFRQPAEEQLALANRMMGPYFFAYWIYPFSYGILSQLFWFKKIKSSLSYRISYAVLVLLALYFERMVILVTSFNRDFVPSSWTMLYERPPFWNELLRLSIFAIFISVTYFVKKRPALPQPE